MVILTSDGARFDRVDRADRHADDADLVTGVEPDRGREVADDLVAAAAGEDST